MFILFKIVWILLTPATLFLLSLVAGVSLLATRWRRLGQGLLVATTLFGVVVAVIPIGTWLLTVLENRFPSPTNLPATVSGIIVLGGAIDPQLSAARGRVAINGNAERLFAFARLAARFPGAVLVYTGGSGDPFDQDHREADAAPPVLEALGISRSRIVFETRSRNTYENAIRTRDRIKPEVGQVWLLVTSARHMPRAMGTFRKAGWPVIAYPVDYVTGGSYPLVRRFSFGGGLGALNAAAKEWLGLMAYYLSDRSDHFFPRPP